MIEAALEVEVDEYVAQLRGHRDAHGHAQVVRNGRGQERAVTVGSGTMKIRAPRVNDKRVVEGERQRFASQILPPYLRRSKNVSELLPLLYLRGLSRAAGRIPCRPRARRRLAPRLGRPRARRHPGHAPG